MFSFVASTLRTRWAAFIGIIVAASTAVALITACGYLLETGVRGTVMPERLSQVSIVVAADQTMSTTSGSGEDRETVTAEATERRRIDAALIADVAATPGVQSAVPEVTFPAHLLDQQGRPVGSPTGGPSWGHRWGSAESTTFEVDEGRAPMAPDEIAIDTQLATHAGVIVGDLVSVTTGGTVAQRTVTATVRHASGSLEHQSALFFADSAPAATERHPGTVDLVVVTLHPKADVDAVADDLRAMLDDDIAVLAGDDMGGAEFIAGNSSLALIAIAGSLGGIAVVVATMVIAGMLALIIQQRHREIALLRAIAATPRQVRRAIKLETLTVVAIGAAIGVLPGVALGRVVLDMWQDKGVVPTMYDSEHGVVPAFVAVLTTFAIGWAAARIAGGRASRIRPIEALNESSVPRAHRHRGRLLLGAVAVVGTMMVFKVAMSIDPYLATALVPALVVLMFVVTAVLAPWYTVIGVHVVSLITGRLSTPSYLAGVNARARTQRVAAAVTPIVLAVGIAGMGLFQQNTSAAERSEQTRQRVIAERVITGGEPGLSPDIVDELSDAEGVDTAVGMQQTEVFYGPDLDPSPAAGLTAGDIGDVLDLHVRSGALRDLTAGTVAISENMADQTDGRLGTTLTFRLGDGHEASARVIAVYSRSVGFADVVLPQELVAEHVTDVALDAVFISGRTTANGEQAVQSTVARHPGAEAGGADLVKRDDDASAKSQAWVGYLLMVLVASFAGIAVVNSLALSTAERVREFALMRLGGTTRRQILRMLRWETLTVILLGCTLGAVVAVVSLIPYSSTTTGSPIPSTPAVMCLGLFGGVVLLALVGTQLPGRLALRAHPVESIGTKQ